MDVEVSGRSDNAEWSRRCKSIRRGGHNAERRPENKLYYAQTHTHIHTSVLVAKFYMYVCTSCAGHNIDRTLTVFRWAGWWGRTPRLPVARVLTVGVGSKAGARASHFV